MEIIKSDISWDRYFFNLCQEISKKSKDPSTSVGCVIVDKNNRIISCGFNGMPIGVADYKERYEDRDVKYLFTEHAERNAIFSACRAGISLENSRIYSRWNPCAECARGIIQSGILEVILDSEYQISDELFERWKMSIDAAETMFREAGVIVRKG